MAAAWLALFFALAFVPDQKILRYKLLALQGGTLALLLAFWAAAWRAERLRRTPLDLPVALYGAGALLFYLLSPEPRNSEAELSRALLCAGAFAAAAQSGARLRSPLSVLDGWAAAAGLAGLYAVLQRLGELGPFLFPQSDRPAGTFGNPIFLAAFLAASAALTARLLAEARGGRRSWLAAALAFQGAGLWLAQSRSAFLGLGAAAALWALARPSGRARTAALGAGAAAALLLAWAFRAREWTHLLIWEGALRLWRDHPWLGCGLGRFHLEFPAYASEALRAVWSQERMIVNYAHSEYLQALAETGPLGLALSAAVPLALLAALLRRPEDGAAEAPALAALAIFAANAASPDMRFGASAFLAFAGAGLAAARWGEWRPLPAGAARGRARGRSGQRRSRGEPGLPVRPRARLAAGDRAPGARRPARAEPAGPAQQPGEHPLFAGRRRARRGLLGALARRAAPATRRPPQPRQAALRARPAQGGRPSRSGGARPRAGQREGPGPP